MIMLDKKKAIATMMAKRNPKDGSVSSAPMAGSDMKSEAGEPDPRHAAAEDMIMALKEGHAGKLVEAMAAFHDLHAAHEDSDEPEVDSGPAKEE